MPFSQSEIDAAGTTAIDFYLRNNPIDQVAVQRPFLRKLMAMSKDFAGAKQYIVEQLRYQYGSNFQWYYGAQAVTYNFRSTIKQANFPWRGAHDGFFLDEDTLLMNGITYTDDGRGGQASRAEGVMLTNLLDENIEALRLGWEEKFDFELHRDGTHDADALEGLDLLVSVSAGATVGGIDSSVNTWFDNNRSLSIASADLPHKIEELHRACTRNGGAPDFYMAGSDFIDAYRDKQRADGTVQLAPGGQQTYDLTVKSRTQDLVSGIEIKGVPVIWNPVFDDLDDASLGGSHPWKKRLYMLNCRHLRLRPAKGHNVISRKPPRVYNRYVHYWALTWKGALTTNRRNAQAVASIS